MRKGLMWFICARGLGLLADEMFLFAVPVVLYAMTKDLWWSGASMVALTLSRILFMPIVASLADRFQLRKQYLVIDLARIVVALSIAALPGRPWPLLVAASALTLMNGHAFVILEKTVAGLAVGDDRARFQARLQTVEQLARVLGPACAGFVLQLGRLFGVALTSAAVFGVSAILIVLFFRPVDAPPASSNKLHRDVVEALRLIWSKPRLTWLIGVSMASNFVEGIILALAPMIFLAQFGRPERDLGVFFSATAGVSILVLTWLSMRKTLRLSNRVGTGLLVSMALLAFALPASRSFFLFAGLYMGFIVLRTIFVVYMRTERARTIDASDFGKVLGIMIALLSLPLPLSGLLVSATTSWLAPGRLQWTATGGAVALSLALYAFVQAKMAKTAQAGPDARVAS